jgi:hypothetical protein
VCLDESLNILVLDDYHLPEDDNHHSHRRGNLKSYILVLSLLPDGYGWNKYIHILPPFGDMRAGYIILYNVWVLTRSVLHPNCTRFATVDAVRIGNFFIYNPNHTSLQSLTIIYYATARLHNYNYYTFVTTATYSTLAR